MMFSKIKKAYTLAEVVVVMLIIAVIGSITIKITSNKMQSITAYTYYAAFNTLRTVVGNLIAEAQLAQNAEGATQATLPSNGTTFCQAFVKNVNTNGDETCQGDTFSIGKSAGYFADKKPDVVLKNGIKLYNLRAQPVQPILGGGAFTYSTYLCSYSNNNVCTSGIVQGKISDVQSYLVFADIDGDSGSSTYNVDVFLFYITLSGKVIPLDVSSQASLNVLDPFTSSVPLKVSVQYDDYSSGNRVVRWMEPKSTEFQQAACMSNYIPLTSTYCRAYQDDADTIIAHNTCVNAEHDCRMMYEKPLRK